MLGGLVEQISASIAGDILNAIRTGVKGVIAAAMQSIKNAAAAAIEDISRERSSAEASIKQLAEMRSGKLSEQPWEAIMRSEGKVTSICTICAAELFGLPGADGRWHKTKWHPSNGGMLLGDHPDRQRQEHVDSEAHKACEEARRVRLADPIRNAFAATQAARRKAMGNVFKVVGHLARACQSFNSGESLVELIDEISPGACGYREHSRETFAAGAKCMEQVMLREITVFFNTPSIHTGKTPHGSPSVDKVSVEKKQFQIGNIRCNVSGNPYVINMGMPEVGSDYVDAVAKNAEAGGYCLFQLMMDSMDEVAVCMGVWY